MASALARNIFRSFSVVSLAHSLSSRFTLHTVAGRIASGVLLRCSGGSFPTSISFTEVFPAPAEPYDSSLHSHALIRPYFIASSNCRRFSAVPVGT